jgi:hypothetical protein
VTSTYVIPEGTVYVCSVPSWVKTAGAGPDAAPAGALVSASVHIASTPIAAAAFPTAGIMSRGG